jgi:hypothetical protein
MENRHGLAVAGMVTLATGTAERRASETMLKAKVKKLGRRITVGEDKAYNTADHVTICAPSTSRRMWHRTTASPLNRQASPQRHRRTHHAAPRLRHLAIVPGDDRMYLRLGQTARYNAQNQAPRHRRRCCRFPAQLDRLRSDPHPQTGRGVVHSRMCPLYVSGLIRPHDRKPLLLGPYAIEVNTTTPVSHAAQ